MVILKEEDNSTMNNNPKTFPKSAGFKLTLKHLCLGLLLVFQINLLQAQQVKAGVDSTNVLIGEQITYAINVEADSTDLVMFPEGQSFVPLEVIETYKTDTSYAGAKMNLIKRYGLTQFDSGSYTIPRQVISINQKPFYTDSISVEVNNVAVDTTKQGLYDIKEIVEVERATSKIWEYLLYFLLLAVVIGIFLFFIIRRSRKKAEAARKLPPFEQAMVSLKQLDEEYKEPARGLSAQDVSKAYYSKLTDIVRHYLDEEVYDRSMESTSGELIERLLEEKQKGRIDLSKETILKLDQILKRADLTKFARTAPGEGQAQADRIVAEEIVKETKESIPEPTEEELMRDAAYREALAKRRKRKLILTGVLGVFAILVISTGILIATKGFDFVKDNFIGHPSKDLLEGDWVRSEYGYPPIIVSTPRVLERGEIPMPDSLAVMMNMNTFAYGSLIDQFYVAVNNVRYSAKQEANLDGAVQGMISTLEANGAKNLVVKTEKYTTPEGTEGLRVFGSGEFPQTLNKKKFDAGEYELLLFTTPGVLQQVMVTWREDDRYAAQIAQRIINSVELQKTVPTNVK
ncbi:MULTISPECIES: hypothetical protein [unclassified Leeuwenhoekiella]|uniref:hypothetical protein n=2 Tax=unclassified Leeuwenhoekiella TaxID=2615029 RepID=UPI000C683CAD|nr:MULTISPECIES: hypothetical protein [unclassified Leeuwenhoekiella]MAW95874.1 hypothetical protein [Leeuwenhoekiella sp.]MBA82855.1 hypothetical protein [Leeuwenhoekiella sp.]